MNGAVERVQGLIETESDYVVELTRELVQNPVREPEVRAGQRDQPRGRCPGARALPARCHRLRHRAVGGATRQTERDRHAPGREERSLILCGHVDVVPVGNRHNWSHDPFGAKVENGRIYGRGAVDMKSGVAACITAMHFIGKAGLELGGRVSMHSVVDEEAGGFGAMDAVKRGHMAGAALIAEPSWSQVQPAEGGLEWVRITLTGRSGHAGFRFNDIFPQPHLDGRLLPAVNAIELAVRFLNALRDFEAARCRNRYHPLVPAGLNTINPGVIHAGVGVAEDGLPAIRTNPAMTPDTAVIDLDFKFLPNETSAEVRAEFEHFVHHFAQTDPWLREHPPEVRWELGGLHFPPMDTPVDHPLVGSLIERHAALAGRAPKITGMNAVTDAAHYAGAGADCVIYGPDGDGFHGDDEYVDIDSLIRTTQVIAATVIDYCGASEKRA